MEDARPRLTMDQARQLTSTALRDATLADAVEHATPAQLAATLAFGQCRSGEASPEATPGQSPSLCLMQPDGLCKAGCYEGEPDCPSTSLDTTETSVRADVERFLAEKSTAPQTPANSELNCNWASRFRHSSWWSIRKRIHAALVRTGQTSSRIASFCGCGAGASIERSELDPTRFRIKGSNCHDRLCTPCANQRSMRLTAALQSMIGSEGVSFITLTLSGKNQSLVEIVDRLYKHFRALRLHPLWDEAVEGGAAFLEIKYNDKSQRWHPHLHIIAKAKFIDQGRLSDVWRGITKDSFIVDVRKVRDVETTSRYVTKYASKPLNMSFANDPELLDEAIHAMRGRRLCLCFGSWYGTPLDLAEDETLADDEVDAGKFSFWLDLDSVIQAANGGDRDSIAMLKGLGMEAKWRAALTAHL